MYKRRSRRGELYGGLMLLATIPLWIFLIYIMTGRNNEPEVQPKPVVKVKAQIETTEVVEPETETEATWYGELYRWFTSHEGQEVTLFKKSENNLALLRGTNNQGDVLFEYRTNAWSSTQEEWEKIGSFATTDIVDIAFVVYHEVGGSETSREGLQAQVAVLQNRVNSTEFPDTFREVISQEKQYDSAEMALSRSLKGNGGELELGSIERCFQETLLFLSNEKVRWYPSDWIYAVAFDGYAGKVAEECIDGTFYYR